jgi:hypothetical protein
MGRSRPRELCRGPEGQRGTLRGARGDTATALLGAKTIEDVFELNTALAKANIAGIIERSAKLSELSIKVANETLAPLGGRMEATIHKLSKPLAA